MKGAFRPIRPPEALVSKPARIVLLAALLALAGGGCVPVGVGVMVAKKTLATALEDRSLAQQVEDAKIHAHLLKEYLRVDSGLPVDVNTDVWEGRALLTGVVDAEWKREAVLRIARSDPRIRALYDYVLLGSAVEVERNRAAAETKPAAERDIVKISRIASDVWIEAKLKTQFLATEGVRSVNYRWQAVRNRVHIIGRARTELEKNLVLQIIRGTRGVLRIEEHIEIKPVRQ